MTTRDKMAQSMRIEMYDDETFEEEGDKKRKMSMVVDHPANSSISSGRSSVRRLTQHRKNQNKAVGILTKLLPRRTSSKTDSFGGKADFENVFMVNPAQPRGDMLDFDDKRSGMSRSFGTSFHGDNISPYVDMSPLVSR